MQKALIVVARALTRAIDLMVAAGEEDQRARSQAPRPTQCQYAPDKDQMVTAVVHGMALALEMGQSAWNERHAGGARNRLRSEEHTSELQSLTKLVCRPL